MANSCVSNDYFLFLNVFLSQNMEKSYNEIIRGNTVALKQFANRIPEKLLFETLGQKEATHKIKFNFFVEITKVDHKLSKAFCFIKITSNYHALRLS